MPSSLCELWNMLVLRRDKLISINLKAGKPPKIRSAPGRSPAMHTSKGRFCISFIVQDWGVLSIDSKTIPPCLSLVLKSLWRLRARDISENHKLWRPLQTDDQSDSTIDTIVTTAIILRIASNSRMRLKLWSREATSKSMFEVEKITPSRSQQYVWSKRRIIINQRLGLSTWSWGKLTVKDDQVNQKITCCKGDVSQTLLPFRMKT